jgi:cell division protein FtsI/penicillin-binding protein 2
VTQQAATVDVPARRGTIVDRKGVELAVSEPASDVSATPYLVKDAARVARRLAPVIGREETELLRALTRRDTGFVYLARALPAGRARRVEKLQVPGLTVTPANRRVYPRAWLASQVLGPSAPRGRACPAWSTRTTRSSAAAPASGTSSATPSATRSASASARRPSPAPA